MRGVGTSTSRKVAAAVPRALAPRVIVPAQPKRSRLKKPKAPMPNSRAAKAPSMPRRPGRDSAPPSRLPQPRPSMNAVTTMVTDVMSIP